MRRLLIAKYEKQRARLQAQIQEINAKLAELDPDCWAYVEYDGTLSFPWDCDPSCRSGWAELMNYEGIVYTNVIDVNDETVLTYDPTTGEVLHVEHFIQSVWPRWMDYGTYTASYDHWTGELLDMHYSSPPVPEKPKLHFRMNLPTSDAADCGTEPGA